MVQNILRAAKCFNVGLSGCLIYYVATDAQIAPALGRHLSACGTVTVGCTAFQLVTLAEPNTLFEERATQIDLRFSKRVALGECADSGQRRMSTICSTGPPSRARISPMVRPTGCPRK